MRRLFLRLYLALALVIVGGLGAAAAWSWSQRQPVHERDRSFFVGVPQEVRRAFATHADPDAAARAVEEAIDVRVEVRPLWEVPPIHPRERQRLLNGRPFAPPGPRPEVWVPLPERELLVIVRPRHPHPPGLPLPLLAALLLLGLGAAVAVQLRPLYRELAELARVAERFGAGERGVRVVLPSGAAAAELGARFNDMADRIERLLGSREELLVAVTHELRTPLTRVRFALELLEATDDRAARVEQIAATQRDLDELDALVDEVLAWARLDADPERIRPEDVPLLPVARRLAEEAEGLRGTLQLELDELTVCADRRLLPRALRNCVANAMRHGGGAAVLRAWAEGDRVVVCVDDAGPGIAAADRERVLEPFVRLDAARTRDSGGAGLGLALVAQIAHAHGGSARIEDSPEGGCRVRTEWPAAR